MCTFFLSPDCPAHPSPRPFLLGSSRSHFSSNITTPAQHPLVPRFLMSLLRVADLHASPTASAAVGACASTHYSTTARTPQPVLHALKLLRSKLLPTEQHRLCASTLRVRCLVLGQQLSPPYRATQVGTKNLEASFRTTVGGEPARALMRTRHAALATAPPRRVRTAPSLRTLSCWSARALLALVSFSAGQPAPVVQERRSP